MTRTAFLVLSIAWYVVAAGCAPGNVPPDQAQVTLSNPRVQRINGEDNFLVDFKFTRGKPDRNKNYQFVLISGSNEKYWIDKLWTEKTLAGTIEAEMSFRAATFEPSKYFEGHLEILTGYNQGKSISNTVTFGTPTADDIVGGDGKPAEPTPRRESPAIAQAPPGPAAVPELPAPPVGVGPGRFPRPGGPVGVVPFGGLESAPAGTTGVPPPGVGGSVQPMPLPAAATLSNTLPVGAKQTPLAGGKGGVPFVAADAEHRIVVGFRYAVGSWAGQPALRFLEPVYERREAEGAGESVAREGFVVGGLNANAGQYVHAVQIVFMRLKADGRLDPADSYTSDWLGTKTNASTTPLTGEGAPIIGVHGRKAAILDGIGLVLKP